MRVLFVTPSYFPIVGGSEVFTQTLSVKLNEIGIHADVMTFNMNEKWKPIWRDETVQESSFRVFRESAFNPLPNLPNPLSNLFKLNVVPKLSFVKKFRDYDIVNFVGGADLSFAIFSRFVKRPKLMHFLGIFRRGGMYRYIVDRPLMGIMLKKLMPKLADIFVATSMEERELLLEMGFPEKKVCLVPVGVDADLFRPDKPAKTDNVLLFVGRIERIKGLHILMDALQYLDVPTYVAIIGPRWEEEYVMQIEKMACAINKKGFHKVDFLGSMNQEQLVKWYQKASVVVCPFLYETYSNVVREALACGTPVVSTGSHIAKDRDGILLTSKNAKDLASKISRLLKDEKLRERYGREGRQLVEKHLSWEFVINELRQLYADLLDIQRL